MGGELEAIKFFLDRRCSWIRLENINHEGEIGGKYEHTYTHEVELGPALTALLASVGINSEKKASKDAS